MPGRRADMRTPMLPRPFRVKRVRRELPDTATAEIMAEDGGGVSFQPGQFNMLYVFGMGEVPISISGGSADGARLIHTTRAVGAVTKALASMKPGDILGVRGPFGSGWPMDAARGRDLIFVAGGLGLAPLRPAIHHALANGGRFGKLTVLYGARTPRDILFGKELDNWRARSGMAVQVIVDQATAPWTGNVGMVTNLVSKAEADPSNTTAFVCGPEVMMRHVAMALEKKGIGPGDIWLSMERNMQCACGLCGHCQWGPHFVCKDGPVFRYDRIATLFSIPEL